MKYLTGFISLMFLVSVGVRAQDSLTIQGVRYKADTIIHTHDVGLGTLHTYYRLPDLPLLINVLDVDAKNPDILFETCLSHDTIRGLERPSAMALRNSRPGHVAFAAINGDFYNTVSPNQGHPVNGQVLKGIVAKTPHASRPVIAFDQDKTPYIGIANFAGRVYGPVASYPVKDVNSPREQDNLILFNSYFGSNTRTNQWGTEVVLSFAEDSRVVSQRQKYRVEEVNKLKGSTPIDRDGTILSGHGKAADFLNGFQIGDTLELELLVTPKDLPELNPGWVEMIGGDRAMLKDGIVQENNWPELHPRTAIGFSADRSRIIMVVVDGRSDYSKGVSTKQLADIMKLSGASDALNLDGGGSSVMVVRNKIQNTPSDGTERAVGNALLVVSTAVPGIETTMKLNARHITIPFGRKFQVKASTFDQAGEVIKYLTAEHITWNVAGDVGRIDSDGLFTASGTGGSGLITGTWNNITDTITVSVKPLDQIGFSVRNLVIDNRRDYHFKVYGVGFDGVKYFMDNDIIHFKSMDENVAVVDDQGVLRGKTNGIAAIVVDTGREGQTDTCLIHVETGTGYLLLDDFSEPGTWTPTLSQVSQVSLSRAVHPVLQTEMMKVDYAFTYSNRTASITLSKDIGIFGMPDSIMMEAIGTGYRNAYYFTLDHMFGLCQVPVFTDSTLAVRKAAVRTADFNQEDYPIPLKSIRLIIERDPLYIQGTRYTGSFWLKGLYAVYPDRQSNYVSLLKEDAESLQVYPNPVRQGFYVRTGDHRNCMADLSVFCSTGRKFIAREIYLDERGESGYISFENIPPGFYLVNISGWDFRVNGKILVIP